MSDSQQQLQLQERGASKTPATGNEVDFFTEEELASTSVRDLYVARCAALRQTPSAHLLKQLPASVEDIDEVSSLDLSNCYLGRLGLATVYPVIAACHRVVHLNMCNVGLDAGTVLPLLHILNGRHAGVRELVLCKNRLGTETALKLCSIAYSRGLLYRVDLDDAWVVEPLRKRLQRILDANGQPAARERRPVPPRRYAQRPAFDLIADAPPPPPDVAPEDEQIPPAMARIAHQLRGVIQRHSASPATGSGGGAVRMRDLQAMFRPLVPGVCSVRSFMRVAKLLNVTAVEGEHLLHDFSDRMGATVMVEGERVVKFGQILAALRDHCCVRAVGVAAEDAAAAADGEQGKSGTEAEENQQQVDRVFSPLVATQLCEPPSKELRDMLDDIYDSRPAILESCEMIDADATGVLAFDDFVVGMAAATQTQRVNAERLLCFWLDALGCGVPAATQTLDRSSSPSRSANGGDSTAPHTPRSQLRVPYRAMLQSLELRVNSNLPTTVDGWREWTPRMLRAL